MAQQHLDKTRNESGDLATAKIEANFTDLYNTGASGLNPTLTTLLLTGLLTESSAAAVSANATQTQAAATKLTLQVNNVTTNATAGNGVALPAAVGGQVVFVANSSALALQVYGDSASADTINGVATATGVSQAAGSVVAYVCTVGGAAGKWVALGPQATQALAYAAATNTTGFTATGAQLTGGTHKVILNLTGTLGGGAALTLPSVAVVVAAMLVAGIVPAIGMTYELEVQNNSSGNFAWTLTRDAGSTWTLSGTAQTVAQTTKRSWLVTLTSLTAGTMQSLGQFAISAAP